MPSLTIRKISEEDKRRLRVRAAHNDRSMEEEARVILQQALHGEPLEASLDLVSAIRRRFEPLGGVELPEVRREPLPEPPEFD